MPPKRGQKRKAATASKNATNGDVDLTPPDRDTWPGWVEMESEPAFFNVMLKEMGVRGVKVQEVYSMDESMLAILPQPVHALIFLFRYRTSLDQQVADQPPETDHIWFANQIPDFACATVALLNIVNNIPGLEMGKDLRDFKDFTQDMTPYTRGETIDTFDFVKKIHNSFARDNDLLQADMHMKNKLATWKRKEAAAKGRATKAAKKAAAEKAPLQERSANARPGRRTARSRKAAGNADAVSSEESTPARRSTQSRKSSQSNPDGDYEPDAKKPKLEDDPESKDEAADEKLNGVEKEDPAETSTDELAGANTAKAQPPAANLRRSGRARKAPKSFAKGEDEDEVVPEEGFHFIAYMPIDDHVWKLDGLNYYPEDMGSFGASGNGADGGTGNWLDAAAPAIMGRMAEFEGASIEFNLMAVVHDPAIKEKSDLVQNVKALQAVETKLTAIVEDWNEMEGGETKSSVITGTSTEFDITQGDIDTADLPTAIEEEISNEDGLLELLSIRQRILGQQEVLRAGLRDATISAKEDDEKARHRRHDYGAFVRKWMGALAENEVLGSLVDG